jgi:hypothetical protein
MRGMVAWEREDIACLRFLPVVGMLRAFGLYWRGIGCLRERTESDLPEKYPEEKYQAL